MVVFLGLFAAVTLFPQGHGAKGDERQRPTPLLNRRDWQVHRPAGGADAQLTRDLTNHPWREDLAIRLIRGCDRKVAEARLQQLDREATQRPGDHAAQLAHAQMLLAAGRWQQAEFRFGRAIEIDPTDFASRWGRARALEGMGARRAAVVELGAALGLAREPGDTARAGLKLISAAQAEGDIDAEIEGRQALVRARPSSGSTFELAVTLNKAGRSLPAAEVLAAYVHKVLRPKDRARWMLAEAQYRSKAGDLGGAAAALERARTLAVRLPVGLRRDIWLSLIDVGRRKGTLDRLKGELATPSNVVEWEARARVADAAGDLPGAMLAFEEAVRRSPGDVSLRLLQIAVARRVATNQQVGRLYMALITVAARNGSENVAVVIEALNGLWQLGLDREARGAFDSLLAGGRPGVQMLRALADSATRWGDDQRAEICWTALLRRVPGDEGALVAIGELQLQRGQRRLAAETWRRLVRGSKRSRADVHAKVAEILADHDCLDLALAEARAAVDLFSGEARYHRLMASIFERQARIADAEREWEIVLRSASGAARAADRKEAHARLLTLWSRAGAGKLDAKLRDLEKGLEHDGRDGETLTFLVEAEIRTGRTETAIARLIKVLSKAAPDASPPRADVDTDADLILLLVRTLRQSHRTGEAMDWLEQLIRRFPARAREARLQLADIALGAHDDRRAQEFANLAATSDPSDPRVVLRAATVQERLGHFAEAGAMYSRIVGAEHGDSVATLAWASLLSRLGDVDEQRGLLREVLCHGTDPDTIALAGARATILEEAAGSLEDVEALLADTPDLNGSSPEAAARRQVLAAMLWRLVPSVYRQQWQDASSLARLRNFARQGLRPLLDLVNTPDVDPDPHAIEVLGMMGRTEAASGLARVLALETDAPALGSLSPARTRRSLSDEVVSLTVIALGRLGGDVARGALESFEQHAPRPSSRVPLLWALGRVGGQHAIEMAKQEISRKTTDAGILGCLTLGRLGGVGAESLLVAVAAEATAPTLVRVAAILGLGLGAHTDTAPALARFVESADRALARAARTALGWLGRPTVGEPQAAGVPSGPTLVAAVAAEAAAITGGRVDPEALIEALLDPPTWRGLGPAADQESRTRRADGQELRDSPP